MISAFENQFPVSVRDWIDAFKQWRLWTALGSEDLTERYRRTLFGISWVAASFAAFVLVKIVVFGQMTSISQTEFAIFVTIGFGLWCFINAVVCEACTAYISATSWIKGSATPYPVFILQMVYRNWLIFALILMVMLAILLWKSNSWSPVMLMCLPGLLVYAIAPLWIAALLAPICACYRDVQHAVQTVMRLMFFVTPILWVPSQTPQLAKIAEFNPMTHFIEIVRAPLVSGTVPYDSWFVVTVINAIGIVMGGVVYVASRNRIVYWL